MNIELEQLLEKKLGQKDTRGIEYSNLAARLSLTFKILYRHSIDIFVSRYMTPFHLEIMARDLQRNPLP